MKVQKNRTGKFVKQRIIKLVISLVCIALLGGGLYIGFSVFQQIKDFDIKNLTSSSTSQILDANGKTIYKFGATNAKYVKYDQMPEVLIDAVVAAEDSRYFIHDGFDLPRIIKALLSNVVARRTVAGGSTITQQLIKKTYYPDEERTIQRKLGEVILSIEATKQTDKKKILELYLNKIYFGRNQQTIGIYSASYYYFDKSPDKLTLPEAALLAGTINSPYWYDPFTDITKATKRRNTILNLMLQHGYISKAECEDTKSIPVENTLKSNPVSINKGYASYVDRVTREVKEKTSYDPTKTNMTIYTYMDPTVQNRLDEISNGTDYSYTNSDIQVGSAVVTAKTGRITGLLSAKNYRTGLMDYAYRSYHQPGSSIKPIISYAPAFEYLYWSTGHIADDSEYTSGSWKPKNVDKRYHGNVTLYEALGQSWNLASIHTYLDVINKIGKTRMTTWLKNLGYTINSTTNKNGVNTSWAIGGWDDGVTPLQQAAAYATISNGGTYIEPHAVSKIVINTTGETVDIDKQAQSNAVQAMSDSTAFLLREVMTSYVKKYGSYRAVNSFGDEIGAKTGTTNDAKDRWFVCYNPDYAWATWGGYVTTKSKYRSNDDAKNISLEIAKVLHEKGVQNSYEKPDSVVKASYVKGVYPYVKPSSKTPSSMKAEAWFTKGHTPSGSDDGDYALESLSSFSASVDSSNKISVNFAAYPESSKYSAEYVVNVLKDGSTVANEKFTTNTATLAYVPTEGTYTVTGYYQMKGSSVTSNRISQSITVGNAASNQTTENTENNTENTEEATATVATNVSNGSTINSSSISFSTAGSGTISFKLTGGATSSQSVNAGQRVTFSGLPASSSFNVTYTDGNGKSLGSLSFKTA